VAADPEKDKDEDADFDGKKVDVKVVKRNQSLPSMVAKKKSKKGRFVRAGRKKVGDDTPQKMIDAAKRDLQKGDKKSFPDLNKDGKITKADILMGRGVKPAGKTDKSQ
tara:strand:- start:969 stop:1292 length:324 start_codon:yes stop_codon:yes gene_type:complete